MKRFINKRVYIGPPGNERMVWIDVRCRKATEGTTINGALVHCLKARAGVDVGCAISLMGADPANADAFPAKPLMVAVHKTVCVVITKMRGANRADGFIYSHRLGSIVDANDEKTLKKAARENPEMMERPFQLLPYQTTTPHKRRGTSGVDSNKNPKPPQTYVPRGALRRAVKAGIISREVAKQWSRRSAA